MKFTPEQQAHHCRILLERWDTIPNENVFPGLFRFVTRRVRKPTCGTVACGGGWVALMPDFQAMGISPGASGEPVFDDKEACTSLLSFNVAELFFGAIDLFSVRSRNETGTDHEVFRKRVERALQNALERAKESACS